MRRFHFLPLLFAFGLAYQGLAQAPDIAAASPPAALPQFPASPERVINRQATPVGDSLLLYTEPTETSQKLRISHWRQLYVRSAVDSIWCRALYGGAQFYVRRTDVTLLAPSGPGTAGAKKPAGKAKPRR